MKPGGIVALNTEKAATLALLILGLFRPRFRCFGEVPFARVFFETHLSGHYVSRIPITRSQVATLGAS
jgi:hypothetical protein